MNPNQEAAWEEMQAQQDYMNEAFGGSVPDGMVEAWINDCDGIESEGGIAPDYTTWKTATLKAQEERRNAPVVELAVDPNVTCPF